MPVKKKKKVKEPVDPLEGLHEEKQVSTKDPKLVEEYVLKHLGTPKNLMNVEVIHYNWGEDKDDRWRVNVVVEEDIETVYGTKTKILKRKHSYFLHFNHDTKKATYCNPEIQKVY